jgi:hypothetical protein
MPCDGIAVLTAQTQADLEAHFAGEANRDAFIAHLNQHGIPTGTEARRWWWFDHWTETYRFKIGPSAYLVFEDGQITLRGQRDELRAEDIVRVYTLTQQYAAQIVQAQVLQTLQALGLQPQNLAYRTDGTLNFTLEV